jgi:PhzF family phenazine biosynthesis protein
MPSSAEVELYTVDAFTSEPFAGNPAAVCLLEDERSDKWLQAVAAEMNLSETAYLWRSAESQWRLRWFTPAQEVPLCGHATLASAHVLYETGRARKERVEFETRSGTLAATRVPGGAIELDFPAYRSEPAALPVAIAAALGATPVAARLVERAGREETWLVELAEEAEVRRLAPDFRALRTAGAPALIATARGDESGFDCVSRYFAPGAGVDEDPVTGAAHCALGPYWAERLGKKELRAWQASKRGGELGVRVAGDRVALVGRAVTVVRGTLLR